MRNSLKGYRDFRPIHLLNLVSGYISTTVLCALVCIPVVFIGNITVSSDEGVKTSLSYLLSLLSGPAAAYIVVVIGSLSALTFTLDGALYVFTQLPHLIARNRKRFTLGFVKAVAWPLFITTLYWIMIQRVPMAIPAVGLWFANAIIATRFAMVDSYRAVRDDMTMLDTFGVLVPKKMRLDLAKKNGSLIRAPFTAWGDAVLVVPMLQAFAVNIVAIGIMASSADITTFSNENMAWRYMVPLGTMSFVWFAAIKLVDAFKPWGERGKLSLLRDARGDSIEYRRNGLVSEKR